MSEYQYYEFLAVDRPLTPEEMKELRALSTRATITPTRLQNVYHWGNFKGDPLKLMEKYFDAFVYVANWGTHRFMIRLPERLLDPHSLEPYILDGWLDVHRKGGNLILDFQYQDENGGGWVEDSEAESWMPALVPLRAELAGGDLRALYLAWLAAARNGWLEDEEEQEPPLPAGLGQLSGSLRALAEFMELDEDLIAVAAAASAQRAEGPNSDELARWVTALPVAEKDALLVRLARGEAAHLRADLLARYRQASALDPGPTSPRRTVGELLAAADAHAEQRQRREAAARAAEEARRAEEQAIARARRLDSLAGKEEQLWQNVSTLVDVGRAREYDEAVQLLLDLRDLGARQGDSGAFAERMRELRARYARRTALLDRLKRAGL